MHLEAITKILNATFGFKIKNYIAALNGVKF